MTLVANSSTGLQQRISPTRLPNSVRIFCVSILRLIFLRPTNSPRKRGLVYEPTCRSSKTWLWRRPSQKTEIIRRARNNGQPAPGQIPRTRPYIEWSYALHRSPDVSPALLHLFSVNSLLPD